MKEIEIEFEQAEDLSALLFKQIGTGEWKTSQQMYATVDLLVRLVIAASQKHDIAPDILAHASVTLMGELFQDYTSCGEEVH